MKIDVKKGGKDLAFIAIMASLLIVGKFALSFIPNIEVVTTLVICFGVLFEFKILFATLVFCVVDIFIYPPSLDVIISYFIYWNLLSIIVSSLSYLKIENFNVYLIIGVSMTAFFGVITSFTTSVIMGLPFYAVYVSGLLYYALHVVSTLAFMLVGFKPIVKVLKNVEGNKI